MRLFNTALPVLYPLYNTSQEYDFHWVLCWLGAWMRRSKHRQNCSPEGVKLVSLGFEIKICFASINGILGLWKFKHFLWFWDFGFWRKEKGSSEHSSDREHRFCVLHYRQLLLTMKKCVRLGLPLRQPSLISLDRIHAMWNCSPCH